MEKNRDQADQLMETLLFPEPKELDELIAGISHHFNNIFSIIQCYSSISRGLADDKIEVEKNLKIIRDSVSRGIKLIEKLKLYTQKTSVCFEIIEVSQLLTEVIYRNHKESGSKLDISLKRDYQDLTITGDRKLLQRALYELLLNAIDAMPDGGKIKIITDMIPDKKIRAISREVDSGSYALISIEDTGAGIEDAMRDKIFKPFFTTKNYGEGTGLGLAVVYGVVARHKGFIRLASKPEYGTKISLYLPVPELSSQS